jgi:hypothetical protein
MANAPIKSKTISLQRSLQVNERNHPAVIAQSASAPVAERWNSPMPQADHSFRHEIYETGTNHFNSLPVAKRRPRKNSQNVTRVPKSGKNKIP